MSQRGGLIPGDVIKEQSSYELFRNRFIIFIIAVTALIAAFAWNNFGLIAIRDQLDDNPIRAAFLYAVLMTIIFIIVIAIASVVVKRIYEF